MKKINKNNQSKNILEYSNIFDYFYENEGNSFINEINSKNNKGKIKKRKKLFGLKNKKQKIHFDIFLFLTIGLLIITLLIFLLFKFKKTLKRSNHIKRISQELNNQSLSLNTTNVLIDKNTTKTESFSIIEKLNQTYKEKGRLLWNDTEPNPKKLKEDIKSYENLNITINFTETEEFYKRENPKISIIITVYNQEKYLKRVYLSILNQNFTDIEIIFIDDASTDNSSNIIKEFMIEDKRIVYLKNDVNRRTYYSRSRGINNATGEYIIIIDPDDFIFNHILYKAYETSKFFDLDILQFYMFIGPRLFKEVKYKNGILYQPKLKEIFYYGQSRNIVDKLIKRDIFVKALDFMDEKYRNERFQLHDDDVCFYGLINVANSYGFLEDIGYQYSLNNPNSTMGSRFKPENMDNIFRSLFCIMKYFYEKSGNNTFEKKYVGYNFFSKKVKLYQKYIKYLNKGFNFYNQVLDLYLNSSFFTFNEKEKLLSFKNDINIVRAQNKTLI